jgi:hypothetical protein
LLKSFAGKSQVVEWLEEGLAEEITFSEYPADAEYSI